MMNGVAVGLKSAFGQVYKGEMSLEDVSISLGFDISDLVADVLNIRQSVEDATILDDVTARSIQEYIFRNCDGRAILLQFVFAFESLHHTQVPYHPQINRNGCLQSDAAVPLALECLYLYAALARWMGLNDLASEMEGASMAVLFPNAHAQSEAYLNDASHKSKDIFGMIKERLKGGLANEARLPSLVDHVKIKTRVKSTSSFMRKELTLTDLTKGGRNKDDIYDVLGVRVIIHPKSIDRPEEAEHLAIEGCYVVRDVAFDLWPAIPERSKDYIRRPKLNGYRSLHSTHIITNPIPERVHSTKPITPERIHPRKPITNEETKRDEKEMKGDVVSYPLLDDIHNGTYVLDDPAENEDAWMKQTKMNEGDIPFELQIRTKKMDDEAECGPSSHALYKSGFNV